MIKYKYSYDIKRERKKPVLPCGEKAFAGLQAKRALRQRCRKILVLPYQRGAAVCRPAGLGYEENLEEKGNRV